MSDLAPCILTTRHTALSSPYRVGGAHPSPHGAFRAAAQGSDAGLPDEEMKASTVVGSTPDTQTMAGLDLGSGSFSVKANSRSS